MLPQIINRLDDIILGEIKERENSGFEENVTYDFSNSLHGKPCQEKGKRMR